MSALAVAKNSKKPSVSRTSTRNANAAAIAEFFGSKGNKYHAKRTEYNGVMYHSKREAAYAAELDLLVRAKEIKSWSRQIPFDLVLDGETICKYTIDFEITHNDGKTELVEIKGRETRDWQLKDRLFRILNKSRNYKVIK